MTSQSENYFMVNWISNIYRKKLTNILIPEVTVGLMVMALGWDLRVMGSNHSQIFSQSLTLDIQNNTNYNH